MGKETPDEMARFNRACHLDKTEHGTRGHDMAKVIEGARVLAKSPLGNSCHIDSNEKVSKSMVTHAEAGLGAGGGRLNDAASSIKSGARAPKADMAFLRKG